MESIWEWLTNGKNFWYWYVPLMGGILLYGVILFIVEWRQTAREQKQKETTRQNPGKDLDKKPLTAVKLSSPTKPLEETVAGQLATKIKQQEQEQVQEIVESVSSYLRSMSPHGVDLTGKVHIHYKNVIGGENLNNKRVQGGVEASLERLGFSDVKVVFNSYAGNSIELRLPGHPKS